MAINWLDAVKIGVTSGLFVGVFNQVATSLREKLQRNFTGEQQRLERTHKEGLQRSELEHNDALQSHERAHKEKLQTKDFGHQVRMRQLQDHFDARSDHLKSAKKVEDWIRFHWAEDHGFEVEYVNEFHAPPSLGGVAAVLSEVARVRAGHPTASVRKLASDLYDKIDGEYSSLRLGDDGAYVNGEPGSDQYAEWATKARELIESIHILPTPIAG